MDRAVSEHVTEHARQPAVSVVIPNCNRRDLLERCLRALGQQTRRDFEVIVVDDHSTDSAPEFLDQYQSEARYPLKVIRNDTPRGANASRNQGIRAARGAIIALLDNDSFAEPEWLARIVAAFEDDRVGAVVGKVLDPPARNVFDLTLRGIHHLPGPGPARRLIGCNMAVRRELALEHALDEDRAAPQRTRDGSPDVSVSGRGDEEGLYLSLRAAGWTIIVAPDAVVLHEHHHTGTSFVRQAFRSGRSAARLVYKYHLPQRIDMLPFMLGYATLPLGFISLWLLTIPAFFLLMALAAITYNDLFIKRKTVAQTLVTFPLLLVYYHNRLAGYVLESVRLRTTKHDIQRIHLTGTSRARQ